MWGGEDVERGLYWCGAERMWWRDEVGRVVGVGFSYTHTRLHTHALSERSREDATALRWRQLHPCMLLKHIPKRLEIWSNIRLYHPLCTLIIIL